MRKIYAVVNDNYGNVSDRVEFLFYDKKKAEKYAERMNKENKDRVMYWIEILYLLNDEK